MVDPTQKSGLLPEDDFSTELAKLRHLPDVTGAGPTIVQSQTFYGAAETWVLQTLRQAEVGDTVFLQRITAQGSLRLVVPPKVTAALARLADSITGKNRRKGARKAVQTREERGIEPGFLKNPGKGGRKSKKRSRKPASAV